MENTGPQDTKEMIKALIKVQSALKPVAKNSLNPHFGSHYADLLAIMEASRKLLSENGFAISQTTGFMGDKFVLTTNLLHISGASLSGHYWINAKDVSNPQHLASCVTYARRYGLASIIGLVAEGDDDDGNSASNLIHKEDEPQIQPTSTPSGRYSTISDKMGKRLYAIAMSHKWEQEGLNQELKHVFGYQKISEIKPEDYERICQHFAIEKEEIPL